jgi:hypothetical protein
MQEIWAGFVWLSCNFELFRTFATAESLIQNCYALLCEGSTSRWRESWLLLLQHRIRSAAGKRACFQRALSCLPAGPNRASEKRQPRFPGADRSQVARVESPASDRIAFACCPTGNRTANVPEERPMGGRLSLLHSAGVFVSVWKMARRDRASRRIGAKAYGSAAYEVGGRFGRPSLCWESIGSVLASVYEGFRKIFGGSHSLRHIFNQFQPAKSPAKSGSRIGKVDG